MDRRTLLSTTATAALLAPRFPVRAAPGRRFVEDYSGLDSVPVARELRPSGTEEVSDAVGRWPGPVSIGGGRYSMGGQVAAPDSLHLDMRGMNRVLALDPERRVVRVQAGISWRDLQEAIDPHDLSVSIMQSFSNFTVGGSVSVNCHGRYVNKGPLVNSVRTVQMVRADGQVLELTPDAPASTPGPTGGMPAHAYAPAVGEDPPAEGFSASTPGPTGAMPTRRHAPAVGEVPPAEGFSESTPGPTGAMTARRYAPTVGEVPPAEGSSLFGGVFGGYGGLGVVTEVELDLDRNTRLRRVVEKVDLDAYPDHFGDTIASDPGVVLHNADLRPPGFDEPRLISWVSTDEPATVGERLIPRDRDYRRNPGLLWAVSELPGGKRLRGSIEDRVLGREAIVWRNYEASLDTDSLEPGTRLFSTYLLQEYFIPVANFLPFARTLREVLRAREVNALNVSVRHSPADTRSLLKWAPTEVFSFVLYYKQRTSGRAEREAGVWTRELIDAALANGGRYYLPYRLHATRSQFERAYPEFEEFVALKSRVDPERKFRNLLWDKYL